MTIEEANEEANETASEKPSKGQQTRSALLHAALQQFAAQGFHGTSMRQVAQAAGLAVGGIYNHFASKDELLKAVILEYHPINVVLPALSAVDSDNVEHMLRLIATHFLTTIQARPEMLNILLIELQECQGKHLPELLPMILPKAVPLFQQLQAMRGQLRPIEPLKLLRIFFAGLLAFALTDRLLAGVPSGQAAFGNLDDFLDVLLHGMLANP